MQSLFGLAAVRRAFVETHCRHLHRWFDRRGVWRDAAPPPDSREHLWHACSLLARATPADLRLAQNVLLRTPMQYNGFAPVAAADVLLTFGDRVQAPARRHLLDLLRQYIVYVIEWRFAGEGLMNFAAMDSYCLLAASRLLRDGYEFKHRFAAPACVYNAHRLATLAANGVRLLDYGHSRGALSAEFNSPTYIPITLMALAKLVETAEPGSELRKLALRAEHAVWRETLSFYHPGLGVNVGPYSRAYVADLTGQLSLLRALLTYVGFGHDRSVAAVWDKPHPDVALHHLGNHPFNFSNVAWLLTTRYHLPRDLGKPQESGRVRGITHWSGFGRKVNDRYMPVQGDLLPGGSSSIEQHRAPHWAVGWRQRTNMVGISYPLHLHYAWRRPVRDMKDVRHLTAAVVLQDRLDPYADGAYGEPAQVDIISHAGDVSISGSPRALEFAARPLHQLSVLSTRQWSVNSYLTAHFAAPQRVTLDGELYEGRTIERLAREARCEVDDHGFRYALTYQFPQPVVIRLQPWGKFVRFAGYWYEGRKRRLSEAQLKRFSMRGSFRLLKTPR